MSYLKGLSCLIDLNICYNSYDIGAQHLWRPATSWLYLRSLLANNGRSDCIPCLEQPEANEHLVRYHFEWHPSISAETITLSQTESVGTADHRDHRCVRVHPSENQPFPLVLPRLDIVTRRETEWLPISPQVQTMSSLMHQTFLLQQVSFNWRSAEAFLFLAINSHKLR